MPINLDEVRGPPAMRTDSAQEAKLFHSNAERDRVESMANLFSLVVALDHLERAFVRDSVAQATSVVALRPPR